MARAAYQIQESIGIHGTPYHLAIALAGDFSGFVQAVLVDSKSENSGHLGGAQPIAFPQGDDLVSIGDAVFGAVLIGHLAVPDGIAFRCGICLPLVIVPERNVYAVVHLSSEL